jgi:hypothetical protein
MVIDRFFPSRETLIRQQAFQKPPSAQPGQEARGLSKRQAVSSASIAGTIYRTSFTADSGKVVRPSPNAVVTVMDTFGYNVCRATCDGNGYYSAAIPYPGTYCIWANPQNYSSELYRGYFGNTGDILKAQWLHVAAGEHITGKDITIGSDSLSPKKGVIISGRCFIGSDTTTPKKTSYFSFRFKPTDSTARLSFPSDYQFKSCRIQNDGAYACTTALDPGSYYVFIDRDGGYCANVDTEFVPQWWDGASVSSDPIPVQLSLPVVLKDIHFRSGGAIAGTLKDQLSDSLLSTVTIDIIDKDGYTLQYTYNNGRKTGFYFGGLADGNYYLYAGAGYYDVYQSVYYPQTKSRDSAQVISISGGETKQNIDIVLKRTSDISKPALPMGKILGKVTREDNGAAIAFASVHFNKAAMATDTSFLADSAGNYEAAVPADSSIFISASQYDGTSHDFVKDYYLADASGGSGVKVAVSESKQIDMALKKGGSLAGWLTDAHGARIPGLSSSINGNYIFGFAWKTDFSSFVSNEITDFSGFRFAGVAPGAYTVRFIPFVVSIAGQMVSDYCYAGIPLENVSADNTAFGKTLVMPAATATIKGAVAALPGRETSPQITRSYVYCYGGDSVLAAMSFPLVSSNQSLKALFLSWDAIGSPQWPQSYAIGKLPAGNYALARYILGSAPTLVSRQWLGSEILEKIDLTDYKKFYKEYLKPDIPATAWISLANNEAKQGINFGNVGVISDFRSINVAAPQLRLFHAPGGKRVVIRFSLQSVPSAGNTELSVFTVSGNKVKTFRLNSPKGDVIWDQGKDNANRTSSGVYVFRLSQGGKSAIVKDALVR